MEFKIKPEELATLCTSSDWRIYEATVNMISRLSRIETEVFYRTIFSNSIKTYDLKTIMNCLYAALKKTNTVYAIHLYYALALAEIKNEEFYKNNSIRRFINFVFSNTEISEETYIEKYESLKPFKTAIFKGNPKLKTSDTLKCLEVVSGDNTTRSKSNIALYIKNRTPNKISTLKNVSTDDLKNFPALVNWRDLILRNKISDTEYTRIPAEYEEIFKHYMDHDRAYFVRSSNSGYYSDLELTNTTAYSWDVFNYYFLYCFNLNDSFDAYSGPRANLAIVFLDPKKAMEINKTNYVRIVNRNASLYSFRSVGGANVSFTTERIEALINSPEFIEWRKAVYNVRERTDLFSWSSSWNNWDSSVSALRHYNDRLCSMKEIFNKYLMN